MKEKITDILVDLLLSGVKEKIDSVRDDYKWRKLFVDTGDFWVNSPDTLDKFQEDLYLVFSKDNLSKIAKKLKDENGYDFPQLLYSELHNLMASYEIPVVEAETYIRNFMQMIMAYIKEKKQVFMHKNQSGLQH